MSNAPGRSLTNTLVLALTQCQDQVRKVQEQSTRIERLQRENECLRKELQDAKQVRPTCPVPTFEQNISSQVDDLFHKNVEAQAEIHQLKRKLKAYKAKANGRLAIPISSPPSLPTTPLPSSPNFNTVSSTEAPGSEHEQSPPRKRTKFKETGILHELNTNVAHSTTSPIATASKRSEVEKKIAAKPAVIEDGEDCFFTAQSARLPRSTVNKEDSLHRRLKGLLGAPTPIRSPLGRPRSSSPSKAISNINHTSIEPSAAVSSPWEPRKSPISSPVRPSLGRSFRQDPEDEEPLRARPVSRLSLHNFKPNPRWLDSHGVAYDDFLHGVNANRMKVLAETLPKLPGQNILTDNEILLDFLGPGSETRISSLTDLARKNLLAEAKVRRVAQSIKKPRADYDTAQDPPGFWSTDMPGTQEDEQNKEKARKMEREEVRRRYEEAMRFGQGKYIFADE